jgi:AraC family transcriptional regulator of adaptative response/methylated-DNA-[protein]-cysteine methyltransferase
MRSRAIEFAIAQSSLGLLVLAASERGVCFVSFGDSEPELEEAVRQEFPFAAVRPNPIRLKPWSDLLVGYVDGRCDRLDLPLDVSGTRFQRRVWDALRAIPRGATRSYSELAESLGMPRGARAVARACATNPASVLIPCHRAVGKDGSLTGYAHGLERKRALLEREADGRS